MKTIRFSLALILVIYSVPTFLAGLDIYRGTEPDLSTEWLVICTFFVLSLVCFIANLSEFIKRDKRPLGGK